MKSDNEFVELILTCGSWQEAQMIADVLLEERLVACVEMIEVKSQYRWHGRLEESDEIRLIMQSRADLFDKVEKEVRRLHSYDTFVLHQIPITNISADARKWLVEEITEE